MILLFWACTGAKLPPATDGLLRSDLGTFTSDATGKVQVPLKVQPGTFSVLLSCGPYGFDLTANVTSIQDPGGTSVYDGTSPSEGYLRVVSAPDQLAVLLPTSPGLPVSEGTWTISLDLGRAEASTVACEEVERNGDLPRIPTMELHLVFVGADQAINGLNATGALSLASFSTMLAHAEDLWAPAFTVDPVSTEDFSDDPAPYATLSSTQDAGELLRSTEDGRSLPVFVVPHSTAGDVLQLAPVGTAGLGGNSRSGLVLAMDNLAADPEGLGGDLARGVAQFLGLFPVVSSDGSQTDPLDDTPVCTDSDGDGSLGTEECAGSGAENLLWPAGGAQATQLSDDQVWVLQRNPLLQ